ncbi:MAG: hypothetical protein MUP64_04905 [Anaerolineae bacterium]|nr:hypothetical protein [Anaerolineae bacterium]
MKKLRALGFPFFVCTLVLAAVTMSSSAPAMLSDAALAEAAEPPQPGRTPTDDVALRPMAAPALAGRLQASEPIIIDHTCTDLSQIPDFWI